MSIRPVSAVVVGALALAASAQAQVLVSAVSATTDMGSGFGTSLTNTINGTGLSSLSLTATHDGTIPGNSWVSMGATSGQITFSLGALYQINGFSFWNQNGGGPGAAGSTGIHNVTVLSSTNGTTFNPIAGGPTSFAQVAGATALPPEIFSFAAVSASFIRFQVTSNWGDVQTGFAEVQFSSVPAPASAVIPALIGLGALCRRRR